MPAAAQTKSGGTPMAREHLLGRFSANHLALAENVFLDILTVAIAPQPIADLFDLVITCGVVGQTGRLDGPRADHRRPGLDKLRNPAQQLWRHGLRLRKDQQAVAHSVGQHNPSVVHGHAGQDDVRAANVEVVAGPIGRSPEASCRRSESLRRGLRLEIQKVRDK